MQDYRLVVSCIQLMPYSLHLSKSDRRFSEVSVMQGLRTKVSALIKPQPEGQRLRKEKKSKKSFRERFRILHPDRNANVSIDYPDQNGGWGFNDFLNNRNASGTNHPRNKKSSHKDHGPQSHNVPSSNVLPSGTPSANNHQYRLNYFPLRVTNGEPSPESSTENLPNRLCTPSETAADIGSSNNVLDQNPLGSNPFMKYHQQNAELSHEEGSNHTRWTSDVQEHENAGKDAEIEAQIEYQREVHAARVSRLRDALLTVNPLSNEDVPAGGVPTRHGTGSRYHQYSRPETFANPWRASEHHYIEAESPVTGTKPTTRDSTLAASSGLQTVVEEDEVTFFEIPPPTRALRSRDADNMKRYGRIFRNSELPSPLCIGHNVPAERLGSPPSPRDEEYRLIPRIGKSKPITSINSDPDPGTATSSHSVPRLPNPFPFQQYSDPQAGNLIHSINGSLLRQSLRQDAETNKTSPLLLAQGSSSPQISSKPPSRQPHPHFPQTNDLQFKRNSSTSLLTLPGHHPLPSSSPSSSPSPRFSILSTSSFSTTSTSSLRQKLIRTLGEHELNHQTHNRSRTSSSSSL